MRHRTRAAALARSTALTRIAAPLVAAGLLIAPLTACSGQMPSSAGSGATYDMAAPEPAIAGATGEAMTTREISGASVIRSGDIQLTVEDTAAAAERVADIADDLGGFVESSSISGTSQTSASLLIRVPSDRFDDAFEQLGEVGEVAAQYRSATDVTMQHVDLQARVAALEESVARLTELMRGAASTSELLEAESALSQRQAELDGLRAQLESLERQVEQSAISVNLSTRAAIPGGPANFWDGLLVGIDSLGTALAGGLVVLGVLLPWLVVLAVLAGVVLLIVWLSTRKRRRGAGHRPGADQQPPGADQQQLGGDQQPLTAEHHPYGGGAA